MQSNPNYYYSEGFAKSFRSPRKIINSASLSSSHVAWSSSLVETSWTFRAALAITILTDWDQNLLRNMTQQFFANDSKKCRIARDIKKIVVSITFKNPPKWDNLGIFNHCMLESIVRLYSKRFDKCALLYCIRTLNLLRIDRYIGSMLKNWVLTSAAASIQGWIFPLIAHLLGRKKMYWKKVGTSFFSNLLW